MTEPKKEYHFIDEKKVDVWYFSMPMFHEDWHKAEEMGLKYCYSTSEGSDYWDNDMVFAKTEDADKVTENRSY